MSDNATITLTLYYREDCHLCEDMILELQQTEIKNKFDLNFVNIDSSQEVFEKYKHNIPYLCYHDNKTTIEICKYFFDEYVVINFLTQNIGKITK